MRPRPLPHTEVAARRLRLITTETPEPEWWSDHTRVATPVAAPAPVPASDEAVNLKPPGRHVARRSAGGSGLPRFVGAHVVVVLAVIAVGLALTCWWVLRGVGEEPMAPPQPGVGLLVTPAASTASTGPAGADAAPEAATAPGVVVVDVAGKVRRPGLVELPTGSRVDDALRRAGGARSGVDLAGLNLARVLIDGEQIVVGVPQPQGLPPPVAPGAPTEPGGPTALVDLNVATQTELETLPEVGPVTAMAIIAWREENGGFTSVEELLEVNGIGEATLAVVAPLVTV